MINNSTKNKDELLKLLESLNNLNLYIHNNFKSVWDSLDTHDNKRLLVSINYKFRNILDESIDEIKLKLDEV